MHLYVTIEIESLPRSPLSYNILIHFLPHEIKKSIYSNNWNKISSLKITSKMKLYWFEIEDWNHNNNEIYIPDTLINKQWFHQILES